ncbi:MAG: assimilatory sulfite reductase (NADPH) hemoprotein subunit [Lysobacter sp.]|nr:assimilatory sulfite reductase (NADPH) hemoprotein subunit [Lysobacter sp.]
MDASAAETLKRDSDGLRGTLRDSLADAVTGSLRPGDQVLLKFHGSYQQDDRDLREERRRQKLEPAYQFMIRTRTPGGVLSPAQWLQLDAIASRYAERGLRITTRQALQLHGVLKRELKPTLQGINAALIDTIAACGDVNRNVTVAANPLQSAVHASVFAQAAALSEHLLPHTRAYYELWLDEERIAGGDDAESHYGATYLPRKFKIGFAIPPLNDVDAFAQDLGFIAVLEPRDGRDVLVGYNVVAGGGMGATHGDADTYPRLGDVLGFIHSGDVIATAVAVLTTQRDFGNRSDRKRARLKYTIDDRGLAWFKGEVERRAGFAFAPPRPSAFDHNGDRFGWVDGEDGRAHLTLAVPSGRVRDDGDARWQSGLRALALLLRDSEGVQFRLTPNQNLTLAGIPAALRVRVDALAAGHGIDTWRDATPLQRDALACVALPTCGLAMAEAERYLPALTAKVDALLAAHGIAGAPLHLRISGCPNGCSRPYLGEIALVGRAPGRYNLMLGADHRGQRLNTLYRDNIDEAQILAALDPLFARYATERATGERFGDFLVRAGVIAAPPARTIPLRLAS